MVVWLVFADGGTLTGNFNGEVNLQTSNDINIGSVNAQDITIGNTDGTTTVLLSYV